MTVRLTVKPSELARACNNAHAFLPARSKVKFALMEFDGLYLVVSGSDSYTVGRDWLNITGPMDKHKRIGLDRDGLAALEKAAREDQSDEATLTVIPGDAVTYSGTHRDEDKNIVNRDVTVRAYEMDEQAEEFWDAVKSTYDRVEGRAPVLPGTIAFDPTLLMRFSKVKSDKPERVADLFMTDRLDPVLIKIGPNFKGLIMPIDRAAHAEKVGKEGLW